MISARILLTCLSLLASATAFGPIFRNTARTHGMTKFDADPEDKISVFHHSTNQLIDSYKKTYYFDQLIDHDNPSKGTFKQRYWHNYEFYEQGGPIVLMTPGELDASGFTGYLTNSTVTGMLAQKLNGSTIVLEHRFFGTSNPYDTLTVEAYQVHTIQQAIDDLEYFAKNVKLPQPNGDQLTPGKAPWIMVGGSYPGALTSYAMYNKPDLFYAGWSSSGVVQSLADFWGYYEIVRQSIPQNCSSDIVSVINYIDSVFQEGSATEIWAMQQNFGLGDIKHPDDFANTLMSNAGISSWQSDHAPAFEFCDMLEVDNGKVAPASGWGLHHTLQAWGKYWNQTVYPDTCKGYSNADDCLAYLHKPNLSFWNNATAPNEDRSWAWMICNQFSFWMTGAPVDKPSLMSRAYNVATNERTCGYQFPNAFNVTRSRALLHSLGVNSEYGGWNVTTSRLVFVNGQVDPWRETTMGADFANPTWSEEWQPHLLHDQGHCDDLIIDSSSSTKMKEVQEKAFAAIVGWMRDWKPTSS